MYAKVVAAEKTSKGAVVELALDQKGLKVNTILGGSTSQKRWKVVSRIVYSALRDYHKKFPFEKQKVIILNVSDERLERFKLEVVAQENKGVFRYYIEGVGHKDVPQLGEKLICASY